MALSQGEVRHVAKLAKLAITDAEVSEYGRKLEAVLGYIEVLNSIDIEGIKPTNQVTGLVNVFREDEARDSTADERARLLANAPEIIDGFIATPDSITKFKQ